jgi:tetratricopeptide (TPR) repeat protein
VGHYGLGRRYTYLFQNLVQKQGHPLDLAYTHYGLTVHNSWFGNPGKAIEHGMEAAKYARKAGFLRLRGAVNFMMAETLLYQGYFKEAESLANEVLEIGREGGDAQLEPFALLQLGFSQRLSGYPEEAVALLHQCIEIARSVPDYLSRLQAWIMIGHCYLDMGKLEPGLEAVQEAARIRQEYNVIGGRFLSMVWIAVARAHLMAAEQEGGDGREAQLAESRQACREARKRAGKYRPFQAEAFRLQGTYDWLIGREQQAGQWWQKSLEMANDIEQPYEEAMTYLEMGRRQGKPELLAKAKEILVSLGTRPDLLEIN